MLGLGDRRRNFNSLFKRFAMRADEMTGSPGRGAPNRRANRISGGLSQDMKGRPADPYPPCKYIQAGMVSRQQG